MPAVTWRFAFASFCRESDSIDGARLDFVHRRHDLLEIGSAISESMSDEFSPINRLDIRSNFGDLPSQRIQLPDIRTSGGLPRAIGR